MQNSQYVKLAAQELKKRLPAPFAQIPPCGVILGTGLSDAARTLLPDAAAITFSEIPNFPISAVESHAGQFRAGIMNGMPVIAQQGRCHLYEGRSPAEVCMGARLMGLLGCRELVITNAAGALNPLFEAGQIMLMADMINHTGVSPLTGRNCPEFGERFPDMSEPFDRGLRGLARQCALQLGIALQEGVYIGVHGPEMETPAETRMYRSWGADAVGMSTVLEVTAARHMGMRCLGLSCLTNKNLPDCMAPAPLAEVVRRAEECGPALSRLLALVIGKLAETR